MFTHNVKSFAIAILPVFSFSFFLRLRATQNLCICLFFSSLSLSRQCFWTNWPKFIINPLTCCYSKDSCDQYLVNFIWTNSKELLRDVPLHFFRSIVFFEFSLGMLFLENFKKFRKFHICL